MSVRVQVILDEREAARFKSQALKESKSLSAWLRDAGRKMLDVNRQWQTLTDQGSLSKFFQQCNEREQGFESSWEEHKKIILEGFQGGEPL
jgi:hypothetical protein